MRSSIQRFALESHRSIFTPLAFFHPIESK
nr:MAG TPA: hypothetical protein [Caudoviricetes sp.]